MERWVALVLKTGEVLVGNVGTETGLCERGVVVRRVVVGNVGTETDHCERGFCC